MAARNYADQEHGENAGEPPLRPVVVYDGKCSFCMRWVQRWRNDAGDVAEFQPYQEAAERFPWIDRSAFGKAVHLIEPDGQTTRGAAAILRLYALAGRRVWAWRAYQNIPPLAWMTEWAYSIIAGHRTAADAIDLLLIGPGTQPTSYRTTRQIVLRGLGVIYAIAFLTLWLQIDGLIGSRGILPVQSFLDRVHEVYGSEGYRLVPTLCWFDGSDRFLHILCAGGICAAVAVVLGIAQIPALVMAWAFYLSLTAAGQDFLGFQWDSLLLESGFLAIFFAPWQLWVPPWRILGRSPEPSRAMLWMIRWLLFRLMFLSGILKLTSGETTWRDLTAISYHYMTQPLPTWTSWFMYQLPLWFQKASCCVVFIAEIGVPLMIFGPRRVRLLGFWLLVLFQLLIAGTGNYGFFNLLAIVLCFALPDDEFWRWLLRWRTPAARRDEKFSRLRWPAWITVPLAAVLLIATFPTCIDAFDAQINWPAPVAQLQSFLSPFEIANGYGLFRVMTKTRQEFIIEGSDDGENWLAYEFRWKPGDVASPPAFTTPMMPRLDWQMWFAALDPDQSPWLVSFMHRLLEGSPPVLALLKNDPFADHPPRYVRAMLYDYRFTDAQTRRSTGAWWRRTLVGVYFQVASSH